MFSTGYHAQHPDAVDWSGLPAYPNHNATLHHHMHVPALKRMLVAMCSDAAREGRGLKVVVVGHGSSLGELFGMMRWGELHSVESWRTYKYQQMEWRVEEVRMRSSMR
jgi:hypothetical protein